MSARPSPPSNSPPLPRPRPNPRQPTPARPIPRSRISPSPSSPCPSRSAPRRLRWTPYPRPNPRLLPRPGPSLAPADHPAPRRAQDRRADPARCGLRPGRHRQPAHRGRQRAGRHRPQRRAALCRAMVPRADRFGAGGLPLHRHGTGLCADRVQDGERLLCRGLPAPVRRPGRIDDGPRGARRRLAVPGAACADRRAGAVRQLGADQDRLFGAAGETLISLRSS